MTHSLPMYLTAIALLALSACAAEDAPTAESNLAAAEQITEQTVPEAFAQAAEQPAEEAAEPAQQISEPIEPAEQGLRIVITGFECGDNCYLDYRPLAEPGNETDGKTDGEIDSALCSVDRCADWFGEQAMPTEFVGRSATITVGQGKQYDNAGNVMSEGFPEITSLTVDPAE